MNRFACRDRYPPVAILLDKLARTEQFSFVECLDDPRHFLRIPRYAHDHVALRTLTNLRDLLKPFLMAQAALLADKCRMVGELDMRLSIDAPGLILPNPQHYGTVLTNAAPRPARVGKGCTQIFKHCSNTHSKPP